ncbi:MAG: ThuA domain-containing protein [Clostridia bacterium]|nr:ThuA domain-containing protein [Clostridia bacterium]
MINVTVWFESDKHHFSQAVLDVYPEGIAQAIGDFLCKCDDFNVRVATLDDPDYGLPDDVLNDTDVLLWWGHGRHNQVPDDLVDKIYNRVMRGMGFIPLHSAHFSKPFIKLMGTSCCLQWREGDRERLWCVLPSHPIAQGFNGDFDYIDIPQEEMYGERFDIPQPDELVFIGWFKGGEVFRSGCCWYKGRGKVFYFQPGHETNPTFYIPEIQRIIINAVRWAAPSVPVTELNAPHAKISPEEKIMQNAD